MPEYLYAALMVPTLLVMILLGLPVALSLVVLAFVFAWPVFGDITGLQLYNFVDQVSSNYALSAVPMFVFMGAIIERSGIAERLFVAMRMWLDGYRGGLGLATIAMCAIFAAGTGIVGAVEVMVGMMAIPPMMAARYRHELIAGTICAGGSLGTIIPPSIVVVIYASLANLSVGALFAGILVPGLLMVALFMIYIVIAARRGGEDRSNFVPLPPATLREKLRMTAVAMVPPLVLMICIIGSILAGIAAVTEAAAIGSIGVLILCVIYRRFSLSLVWEALKVTGMLSSMILLIVVGGTMFTSVFIVHRGGDMVGAMISLLGLGDFGTMLLLLFIVFVLGAVLDWVSVLIIALPVFVPILRQTDIDPLWFAVLTIVVIQTSYLTPPMAPSIFYLRGVAPKEMSFGSMYRGVLPFIGCQLITLLIMMLFPLLATWGG